MQMEKYSHIYKYYEKCFAKHGDSHLGVDWPNLPELQVRFNVMLGLIDMNEDASVLDFGCGNGLLYDYLNVQNIQNISYMGLDISNRFINFCREKYPDASFYCLDINKEDLTLDFDYAICNGVFTEKLDLTFSEMFSFFSETISTLFKSANKGIAFNVMSTHVDYEREDLFHLPHDLLAEFITKNLSRKYVIRNDYGLYEYSVYIYK